MENIRIAIVILIALFSGIIGIFYILRAFLNVKHAKSYLEKKVVMIGGLKGTFFLALMGILLIYVYSQTVVIDRYIMERIQKEENKLPEVGLNDEE